MRLRQTWADRPDDFTVLTDDGYAAGRIHLSPGAADNPNRWQWHATILFPGKQASSGRAETREDAMAAFKTVWEPYRAGLTAEQWAAHLRSAKSAEDAREAYERSKQPG
jgi:galactose-1-phosphate uridylyltransferase